MLLISCGLLAADNDSLPSLSLYLRSLTFVTAVSIQILIWQHPRFPSHFIRQCTYYPVPAMQHAQRRSIERQELCPRG
jgi:hypothetical protein